MEQRIDINIVLTSNIEKSTDTSAEKALEFAKEAWFAMQEHGTKDLTEHEIAAATVFRELLGTELTESQIGSELLKRGYTYPAEELA